MSRDDRDWYREAIRERDSKNKVVQFDKKRKVNKTSKKLKSSQDYVRKSHTYHQ